MTVTTKQGQVEDLAAITFDKTPPPIPQFWALSAEQAVHRAFDRLLARYGRWKGDKQTLPAFHKLAPVPFGWGDAGLNHITVYEQIGEVECVTDDKLATYTVHLRTFPIYPDLPKLARKLQFTVPIKDVQQAKNLAAYYLCKS